MNKKKKLKKIPPLYAFYLVVAGILSQLFILLVVYAAG